MTPEYKTHLYCIPFLSNKRIELRLGGFPKEKLNPWKLLGLFTELFNLGWIHCVPLTKGKFSVILRRTIGRSHPR